MTINQRPDPINNRPGLEQLSYRIGNYSSFRQRLLTALTTALQPPVGTPGEAPLAELTTRDANDPAIALLDSWAVTADVLTFYQERIANEGFLRTATERRSVLELARAIGYELDPGVAASTYLSFQVEDAPGSPTVVPIPLRTQVMSVPAKDELPQIFETIADFTARLDWNGLRPRSSRPQRVYPYTRQLYLAGASTQLQPGDLLLLVDDVPDRQTYLLSLQTVTPNPSADYTLVSWRDALPPITTPLRRPQLFAFRLQAHLFGYNAPPWSTMPAEVKLAAIEKGNGTIQGGVFRSDSDGLLWTAASKGLPDSDILCIAARNQVLFAGTPGKGLFRSTDNGQTWAAANEGITSMNILALHISPKESVFNAAVFAGTPNGGVFRSKDQGKNWVAINQGAVRTRQVDPASDAEWEPVNESLPNTVVRSLSTFENAGTQLPGTFTVNEENDPTVTGAPNSASTLKVNDIVHLKLGNFSQRRRVINVPANNSFKIDEPFNLPEGTNYSATATVTFILDGEDQTETRKISSGTISSNGSELIGVDTNFNELLSLLDEVNARDDVSSAEISSIEIEVFEETFSVAIGDDGSFRISDNSLVLEAFPVVLVFRPKSYILAGTDQGIYKAATKADNARERSWLLGENTVDRVAFALKYISGRRVVAGTDDGILTSNDDGATWDTEWDGVLFDSRTVLSLEHYDDFLFAGTAKGIYRFQISDSPSPSDWAAINGSNGADTFNLTIRSVAALATYNRGGTRYLFAATDDGIFVSTNSDGDAEAVTWQRISQDLATQAATALAVDDDSQTLFAGTEFGSFLPAEPNAEVEDSTAGVETTAATPEKAEWPDFTIQDPRQLDLDTLHPQILANRWIVLVDDRNSQDPEAQAEPRYAVRQVPSIAKIDRQDFGLSGKISRLELDVAIDPTQFGLRSARLLGQSTELPLAPEPLTVSDRQRSIWADPIIDDTVYLHSFVQDLQPDQVVMVNGKHMRMQLSDVGGVLRSRHDWQPLNIGLYDLTINALTERSDEVLLVATNEGLYRRTNATKVWKPLPVLRFKTVHSIFLEPAEYDLTLISIADTDELPSAGRNLMTAAKMGDSYYIRIFDRTGNIILDAGESQFSPDEDLVQKLDAALAQPLVDDPTKTDLVKNVASSLGHIPGLQLIGANLDLYRAAPIDARPTKVKLPIAATVLAFHAYTAPEGNLSVGITHISGITIRTPATDIAVGTVINVNDQTRIVTAKDVPTAATPNFLINRIFEPAVSAPTNFAIGGRVWLAGTDRGILRSTDEGKTWEYLEDLRDQQVNCLISRETNSVVEVFAGTDEGLYYSTDSGQSWEQLEDRWNLPNLQAVQAFAQRGSDSNLWIGTATGLYRLGADIDTAPPKLRGLSDRTIFSLHFRANVLYAGTDQGIYRSVNGQDPWEALDAGLSPAIGRVLIAQSDQLLVGTERGLFSTPSPGQKLDPVDWSRSNTGIVNSQMLCLASSPDATTILAGTTAGLYRSTSAGRTWVPFDDDLDQANAPGKLKIQAVFNAKEKGWFVGTPEGVFVYGPLPDKTETHQWQPVGRATLPYQDIRAIAQQGPWLLVGTVDGGLFKLDLNQVAPTEPEILSQPSAKQQWQPTRLNNATVQAIAAAGSHLYAGTARDGLFRSRNQGVTWQQISDRRSSSGTLVSDGNQAVWSGFAASDDLQTGDQITAAGQTRTILEHSGPIPPRTTVTLTLDQPFRPDLVAPTAFTVSTGLTNPDITALAVAAGGQTLYVGTAGSGVFRSTDRGDRWQQIITNLSDLNIRCLLCEDANTVWVGTETAGVYRSVNRGDLWAKASLNLTNTDVRSLLRPNKSTLLVAGIGILKSEDGLTVKPLQRHDEVQVIKPPRPLAPPLLPPPDSPDAPIHPLPQDYRWLLRDKDAFVGLLDTTTEQLFPLLPAADDDALVSEQARIQFPPVNQQLPILTLQESVTYSYDPATVTIAANVVEATHGETALEILGSGDGNTANQRFELKKPPLTYVPAVNARGSASTLEVWVDDVQWEEAASLFALTPADQAYIVRIEDDGTTTVTFGDGDRGARPPSGQENITARYRSGVGSEGNVVAHRLTILKTRPQGIAKVTNALPATGGTDRESLSAARTNAPPTARTLGRIVSLQDFQDFAQGFVGIVKAQAVALWDGSTQVVHITVAGADGVAVPATDALYQSLVGAIAQARDPIQQVQVDSYERLFFNLEAKVMLEPRYQAAIVEPQLRSLLAETFDFNHRGFGQSVTSAEVIAALQSVAGVVAVDLDALYQVGRSRAFNARLPAQTARFNPDTQAIAPAQLFLLSPVGVQLTFVSTL